MVCTSKTFKGGMVVAAFILCCLLWTISASPLVAQVTVSLSASLSNTNIPLGSKAYLRIRVDGARSADIDIPEVANLLFHQGGQSSQMQVINGTFSSSITYTYVVEPLKEGSYTIPAIDVGVDDKTLATKPLSFAVTTKAISQSSPRHGNAEIGEIGSLAFITIEGMPDKAYSGEVMPVTIRAYFRRGIRVEIKKTPEIVGDGFVLSPITEDARQNTESYRGRPYSVITWNSAVSAIKEGRNSLQIDLDATLHVPQDPRRNGLRDPFFDGDPFGNDLFDRLFGGLNEENIKLKSKIRTVTVLSLPQQGRPANFNGAVGSFDFSVEANPRDIVQGEPITLTMTISGNGNFDRVTAPHFPEGQDWKTYTPSGVFASSGNSYTGKKLFEQAVVAQNNLSAIPPLSFSYFDPQEDAYITLTSEPLPLNITTEKGQQQGLSPIDTAAEVNANSQKRKDTSSAPQLQVQLKPGAFSKEIMPVYRKSWFILLALLNTIVLLALALSFFVKRYQGGHRQQIAQKRLNKETAARLAALEQTQRTGDDTAFIRQCREIIQLHLGFTWRMEPSAITLTDLQKRLHRDSELIEIFKTAEQHTYGGLRLSPAEMSNYLEKLKMGLQK